MAMTYIVLVTFLSTVVSVSTGYLFHSPMWNCSMCILNFSKNFQIALQRGFKKDLYFSPCTATLF